MNNGAWENRNIQSGAVLWLRHSFARAFSGDSVMLSVSVASLCLESRKILPIRHCERVKRARQSNVYEARIMRIPNR